MKKRTKKIIISLVSVAVGIAAVIGITIGCLFAFNRPTAAFDFSQKTGAVTNGASGFLYGFAEPEIPSKEMAQSIGVSTLSPKLRAAYSTPSVMSRRLPILFSRRAVKKLLSIRKICMTLGITSSIHWNNTMNGFKKPFPKLRKKILPTKLFTASIMKWTTDSGSVISTSTKTA